jgi:hypothetical protein
MNKICDFLINYYKDNGITDKKSTSTVKCKKENKMTNKQIVEHIKKELNERLKPCVSDIEICRTPTRKSITFMYKENLCEVFIVEYNKDNVFWVLEYY